MKVKIVGSGLISGDVSLNGFKEIKKAGKVFLRSEKLSSAKFLKSEGIVCVAFDDVFEDKESFEEVYSEIARRLEAQNGDVVYVTDGSGASDKVVGYLSCETEIFPACDKAVRLIRGESYTLLSAYDFAEITNIGGEIARNIYISDVDNKFIASSVKLKLSMISGDDDDVLFFDGKEGRTIKVYEIDMQKKYDYNTGILVKNGGFLTKTRFSFTDLLDLISALRAPDGCPWDRAQTHETIRKNVIEEAYEVAEAIDLEDPNKICEEIGDLMMQTVLHADIGRATGEFDMSDVLTELCQKLIDRHPHVFGDVTANDEKSALDSWDNAKAKQKNEKTLCETLDNVAKALPQTTYAEKISKKVGKAGLDFTSAEEIFDKIEEELKELKEATEKGEGVKEELGDLFFSVCNLARFLGEDSEEALSLSTRKFIERAKKTEELVSADGKTMYGMDEKELDGYYTKAKELLKK